MALNNFINRTTKSPPPVKPGNALLGPVPSSKQSPAEASVHPLFRETVIQQDFVRPFESPVQSDFDHTLSEQSAATPRPRAATQVRLPLTPSRKANAQEKRAAFKPQPVEAAYSDQYEESISEKQDHQALAFKGGPAFTTPRGSPKSPRTIRNHHLPNRGSSIRPNMTTIDQVNADFIARRSPDRVSFGEPSSPPPLRHQPSVYPMNHPQPLRPRSELMSHDNRPTAINGRFTGERAFTTNHMHHNGMNGVEHDARRDRLSDQRRSSSTEPPNYDFPEHTLRKIPYQTLKEQSFDTDPNRINFEFPEALRTADIGAKMEHVRTLRSHGSASAVEQQMRFFEGLSLDDWETAGEWFIEKLAANMKDLRRHRKDMRDEAAKFENEVENRFKLVSDTQANIKEELSRMAKHKPELLSPPKNAVPAQNGRN